MGKSPDEIRAEIEQTRAGLGADVDALADKVSPSAVARRRVDAVKGAVGGARASVMGTSSQVSDRISGTSTALSDAASGVPGAAAQKASGNPLAAGLIALGVGWLLSSLIPASSAETQAAAKLKDNAGGLTGELQGVAQDAKESLMPKVQDAIGTVKESGANAAQEVKSTASEGSDTLKSGAGGAAGHVKETVSS